MMDQGYTGAIVVDEASGGLSGFSIEHCASTGKEPDRPFSGESNVRIAPRLRRVRVARFFEVCGADEVAEGRGMAVEVDGLRIAIFQDEGRYHALLGRCPHANGAMGHGWIEEGEAVCPLHRWRFKLSTGRCTTMPGQSLHKFRCEVREGRVWVEV